MNEKEIIDKEINDNLDGSFFEIISNGNSLVRNNSSNSIFTYDSTEKENSLKFKNNINNKKPELGFWAFIKNEIINKKNILIFNIFSNQKKINEEFKELNILNEKFKEQTIQLYNKLYNLIWFSYRANFQLIQIDNNNIMTDAGWGCMIRAGQMFLAQAIKKLFNIEKLDDFISKFIYLFLDNPINSEYLSKPKLDNIKNKNSSLFKSFVNFGSEFEIHGFENIICKNPDFENYNPPFSLRTIITIKSKKNKKPMEWFSNTDISEKLEYINNKYHPLNFFKDKEKNIEIEILNFSDTITLETIIKKCFEKVECKCVKNSYINIKENIFLSFHEYQIISSNNDNVECHCFDNTIIINNIHYKLTKKFIIFISSRHGLYNIQDEKTKEQVLNFFHYKNNIGFIGGKDSKAYYFLGQCEKNLIFLDPHHVQNAVSINDILLGNELNTYKPNDIFYINIDEISPSFTFGFAIKNIFEFEEFINNFGSSFTKNDLYYIKTEITIKSNIDDLFCVRYEEERKIKNPINKVIFLKSKS